MRRLALTIMIALFAVVGCGGESAPEIRRTPFAFLEMPSPDGWLSGTYEDLDTANFNLFPYPAQNDLAVNLFARGATSAFSTVKTDAEGKVSDWMVAASFARPADELILPALTADLRNQMPWTGTVPTLTKISETEYTVSGETAAGHAYLRSFIDSKTIVVVFAGTNSVDHEAFEAILALVTPTVVD